MQGIAGKTVIVTGASAGLGRAIAKSFADAGAKVGLIARTEEALRDAQKEMKGSAIAAADTANPAQLAVAAAQLEDALGPIDIWINNAMETIFSRFADITPEEFKRVTDVTYLGFVYGTMEALRRMLTRGRGHIIQVGSALAYRSIPLQSAYCGGKAAVRGFTDAIRCEMIHDRQDIELSMVHMPALNTPQFSWARTHIERQPQPVGKIFQPEVGARAVLYAARYPKREYWVGSSTVMAILGNKVFPGWMDKKMASMAFEGQWIAGKTQPEREGNLFQPAAQQLHTTHGMFDARARAKSLSWTLRTLFSRG